MIDTQFVTPTYNIKAVAQKTGVKSATIRSWERRYGLPQPERSPSGHRRYSERDVELIRWLAACQDEGISISQAVVQWRQRNDASEPPPPEIQARAAATAVSPSLAGDRLDALRDAWLTACLAFDRQKAEQALAQAFALFPADQVCLELLQKGMAILGQGWERGEVTIQQEHFASALTIHRLEMLLSAAPPPIRPERILIACATEDHHTFSPMLLTYLLRFQGWDVIYLGANVPAVEFEVTVSQIQPDLVIVSAQRLYTAATLMDVASALHKQGVMLAFGGQIFNYTPALRDLIPGNFLGATLDNVALRVAELLEKRPFSPTIRPIPERCQLALQQYKVRRALIEAHVWGIFVAEEYDTTHLTNVNKEVFEAIVAALKLGDTSLLGRDIGWVEYLLISYDFAPEVVKAYIKAYHQAAVIHLSDAAGEIVDWLGKIT